MQLMRGRSAVPNYTERVAAMMREDRKTEKQELQRYFCAVPCTIQTASDGTKKERRNNNKKIFGRNQ